MQACRHAAVQSCCHDSMLSCSQVGMGHVAMQPCRHVGMCRVVMFPCWHVAVQSRCHAAMLPCCHAAMLPCSHAAMLPCIRSTMHPCSHAAMLACCHAPVEPCSHLPCFFWPFQMPQYSWSGVTVEQPWKTALLTICMSCCLRPAAPQFAAPPSLAVPLERRDSGAPAAGQAQGPAPGARCTQRIRRPVYHVGALTICCDIFQLGWRCEQPVRRDRRRLHDESAPLFCAACDECHRARKRMPFCGSAGAGMASCGGHEACCHACWCAMPRLLCMPLTLST